MFEHPQSHTLVAFCPTHRALGEAIVAMDADDS